MREQSRDSNLVYYQEFENFRIVVFDLLSSKKAVIRLNSNDNVAVALHDLQVGQRVTLPDGSVLTLRDDIAFGHKVAVQAIAQGEKVLKYGLPIGSATSDIEAGEHVHVHNLKSDYVWSL